MLLKLVPFLARTKYLLENNFFLYKIQKPCSRKIILLENQFFLPKMYQSKEHHVRIILNNMNQIGPEIII